MREICQSGSMSGNRKQAKPNRTEVARRKPRRLSTGRLQSLRLCSTLLASLTTQINRQITTVKSLKKLIRRSPRFLERFENRLLGPTN